MLNQIDDQKVDRLAELLNVLADPTRMRIILGLTKPSSMSALQRQLQIGQAALAHHLSQMQANGLLNTEQRDGELYYLLTDSSLNKSVKLLLTK
ncbi:ArsR/SmtB family transcription factor [Spirosoma validum]|uniref:Winged helix-turn-helix transcriptional regulator n=1 Tax=Spirosoma validum TaxID=2771355 RepID=A0A927GD65_9BACT|nr:helix-turn-helix domain-containing protein [Spirosoma validum]MBD2753353.1 winged helix-turn-helix transcriptional regulator [Spirosoma validum]